MNWKRWRALFFGLVAVVGCGGEPPNEQAQGAFVPPPPVNAYQTVPGRNTAVTSSVYSCNGWSYRMLFSLEQHLDTGSPTGWYAAVGPSSVAATGAVTDYAGNLDVSADVYLQCIGGIIPEHVMGTFPSGARYNEIYANYTANPIICLLTTVWPASWHATNPTILVKLLQYDWRASIQADSPGGIVYVDIDSYEPAPPGYGFCGRRSFGGGITEVAKFVPPPPPVYTCTGDPYTDYTLHPGCVVPPPDCTIVGHGPCPPPPDAT
jgi:hypothetical protein